MRIALALEVKEGLANLEGGEVLPLEVLDGLDLLDLIGLEGKSYEGGNELELLGILLCQELVGGETPVPNGE